MTWTTSMWLFPLILCVLISQSFEHQSKRFKRDAEEMPAAIPGVDDSSEESDKESKERGQKNPEKLLKGSKTDKEDKVKESDSAEERVDEEEEEEEEEEGKASHKKTSSYRGKSATGKNSAGAHRKHEHGSRHNRRPTRSDRIHDLPDWNDRNWDPYAPPLYGGKRIAPVPLIGEAQIEQASAAEKRVELSGSRGRVKRTYPPPYIPSGHELNEKRSDLFANKPLSKLIEKRANRSKRACNRPEDRGRMFYRGSPNDRCRQICKCSENLGYANCRSQCKDN